MSTKGHSSTSYIRCHLRKCPQHHAGRIFLGPSLLLLSAMCSSGVLALSDPPLRPQLDVLSGLAVQDEIATNVQAINFASIIQQQRMNQKQLALTYGILRGASALRCLEGEARSLLSYLQEDDATRLQNDVKSSSCLSSTAVALIWLCRHKLADAAHEAILAVTMGNVDNAEYAATHPGGTSWSQDHPLTDVDDMLHSVIHRLCEGHLFGEGGYTGWENAAYWAAGGPKLDYNNNARGNTITPEETKQHPVRAALAMAAMKDAPGCVKAGLVTPVCAPLRQHRIISGGKSHRTVTVPQGWWDPFCFINLLQTTSYDAAELDLQKELDWLQELELRLLLRFELLRLELFGLYTVQCDFQHVDAKTLLVWVKRSTHFI